jgi:hypothetical protein
MKDTLYLRGHSVDDISRARHLLKLAEKNKHPHIRYVEKGMFWFTLATGGIGSGILALASIPILVAAKPAPAALVVLVFGVLLGSLIAYISKNMHWLERHHHLSMMFIIPVFALFVFFITTSWVNDISARAGLSSLHDPVLVGLSFALGFIAPYVFLSVFRK